MIRTTITALLALAAATAAPVSAATLYANDFNAEYADGYGMLNYDGFTGLDVTGSVDLLGSGEYGLYCKGEGKCVDLAGSRAGDADGRLTTRQLFSVRAGETVTLAFDMSGNQRPQAADAMRAGFDFAGPLAATNVFATGPAGSAFNGSTGLISGTSIAQSLGGLAPTEDFGRYTVRFTALQDTQFRAFLETSGGDYYGPIIDNLSITSVAAAPEPETWALMIAGFGMAGGALRGRRRTRRALPA